MRAPHQGPYAPQGSRKFPKGSRCSKSVLRTLIRTSQVRYSRSIGEVNSNRITSSLLRKRTRLPTHACEVGALTFEVTDNFGSNVVLPCGAYGPSRPTMRCLSQNCTDVSEPWPHRAVDTPGRGHTRPWTYRAVDTPGRGHTRP